MNSCATKVTFENKGFELRHFRFSYSPVNLLIYSYRVKISEYLEIKTRGEF